MTVVCLIDNTQHKSTVSLCRYLKKLGVPKKEYYDQYLKVEGVGICRACGSETRFVKFAYYKFCDIKCSSVFNGKSNAGIVRSAEMKRKVSESWKTRDPSWLQKRRETIEQKYGVSYTKFKRKQWVDRFSKMSDAEVKAHYDKCVLAQGSSKSMRFKEYQLGEQTVLVQGYEPYVLDVLQKLYTPDQICVSRSKHTMVRYMNENGKESRYFPDIFLPDNVIVEVKSPYTLTNNLENTLLKMQASFDFGYKPLLVIWENKVGRMEMCEKSLIETISSQAWNCTGRFNDYPFIGVGHKQTVSEALGIQI